MKATVDSVTFRSNGTADIAILKPDGNVETMTGVPKDTAVKYRVGATVEKAPPLPWVVARADRKKPDAPTQPATDAAAAPATAGKPAGDVNPTAGGAAATSSAPATAKSKR